MNLKDVGIYDFGNIFTGKPSIKHASTGGTIITNQSSTVSRFINIPAYQRPYRWNSEMIDKLFSDYEDNITGEYFLGSAVAVRSVSCSANNTEEFDIIDGQQRITTLFLLNYIRFLLLKEITLENIEHGLIMMTKTDFVSLRDSYIDLIGKNEEPFTKLITKIDELAADISLDENSKKTVIEDLFRKEMCIPQKKDTLEESIGEKKLQIEKFFLHENFCLKYSRDRYNQTLKNALCNVFIEKEFGTNNLVMDLIDNNPSEFEKNYTYVLKILFNKLWEKAKNKNAIPNPTVKTISIEAVNIINEMLSNLSICVIVAANPSDANKLFEVLNDRSLEVDDLELIKNHFYKEYCSKSADDDRTKDIRITELDALWVDTIFNSDTLHKNIRNEAISYFAAVYLTCDDTLEAKKPGKIKDIIADKYSRYRSTYEYSDIKKDFMVYYAICLILNKFDYVFKNDKKHNKNGRALDAEASNKSITYKTIHLLNAFDYLSIIPAIINLIISTYIHEGNDLLSPSFNNDFGDYLDSIINDNTNSQHNVIHKCSYSLWKATLKSKDFNSPRALAKKIIREYGNYQGNFKYQLSGVGLSTEEDVNLNTELQNWLDKWTHGSRKDFAIKILLLKLLMSQKITDNSLNSFTLSFSGSLAYTLQPKNLELDHLEANNPTPPISNSYYLNNDIAQRKKDVNSYLGNFMILDTQDNNAKDNKPLVDALCYYRSLNESWLIKDIKKMVADNYYFDVRKKRPKKEFFIFRTKYLQECIKSMLTMELNDTQIDIRFDD